MQQDIAIRRTASSRDILFEFSMDDKGRPHLVLGRSAAQVAIAAIGGTVTIVLAVLATLQGVEFAWPPWPVWPATAAAGGLWLARRTKGG